MLSDEQIYKVWELLESQTPYRIGNLSDENLPGVRTIQRLKAVKIGFQENQSYKEICKRTKWSKKKITQLHSLWENYEQLKKHPPIDRQHHITTLIELADELRKRIVNPNLEEQFNKNESTWYYGGQDWHLTPSVWFRVMTPDLEYQKPWGSLLPCLKTHLARSPFMQHYNELKTNTEQLEKEYHEAAQKLTEDDLAFATDWKKLQNNLTDYALTHCKPSQKLALPSEEITPLPYSSEFCEETLVKFVNQITDLHNQFHSMEQKLQQLWNDLDPDVIESLIEQSTCEKCSTNTL